MNNKNNISYDTKPGGKDFINVGIFTVIFLILFMVGIMVMSMSIYTLPFGVAVGSFIGAYVSVSGGRDADTRALPERFGVLRAVRIAVDRVQREEQPGHDLPVLRLRQQARRQEG